MSTNSFLPFVSFHVTAKSEEEAKEEDSTWTAMGHHIFFLTDDCGLGVLGGLVVGNARPHSASPSGYCYKYFVVSNSLARTSVFHSESSPPSTSRFEAAWRPSAYVCLVICLAFSFTRWYVVYVAAFWFPCLLHKCMRPSVAFIYYISVRQAFRKPFFSIPALFVLFLFDCLAYVSKLSSF